MLTPKQQQKLQNIGQGWIRFDVAMANYSTFKAGGRAAALIDIQEEEQLATLLDYCGCEQISWRAIGRGSNILVTDSGYAGIICRLSGTFTTVQQYSESEPEIITVGGGCLLVELLSWCRQQGLGGLEFLTGIPGGVGGAIRMNAGAFGQEIGELLHSVTFAGSDGIMHEIPADALTLSYRNCLCKGFDPGTLIVAAALKLRRTDAQEIARSLEHYKKIRRGKQQIFHPSAGSFFKNPEGDYAGRLIEFAGLKGMQVGGAMVSPAHANFIVNINGRATASEIIELMHRVQKKVQEQTGIFLEPEVHIF